MFFYALFLRRVSRGASWLAIAGIAALLAGLPTAAGATFLRAPGISPGDFAAGASSGFSSDRLTLRASRSEFAERALREHDFSAPDQYPLDGAFERDSFGGAHSGGAGFDGFAPAPWLRHGLLGASPHAIQAMLRMRHFCGTTPPPTVPEPGTGGLLAMGLVALALARRRRRA